MSKERSCSFFATEKGKRETVNAENEALRWLMASFQALLQETCWMLPPRCTVPSTLASFSLGDFKQILKQPLNFF